MPCGSNFPIQKIYILSQIHTNLGCTDLADAAKHHQRDILAQVLDVCEDTATVPHGAEFRRTTSGYCKSARLIFCVGRWI